MKRDLWRFLGVLTPSFLIGLLSGKLFVCLFIGCLLFIIWQNRTFRHLHRWIRHYGKVDPPDMPGIVDEISKEFDFLRMHHRSRKKKLSGYLKRFRKAIQALPDAMIVLDNNGKIEWANSRANDYLGIRMPQDAGQRIVNLVRNLELARLMNSAREDENEASLELASPVNGNLLLEFRLAPYGNKQQLLVARDITRIHRSNQMRRDFIANASHELRTPLTVISGYLESMEDQSHGDMEEWNYQILQMRRQAERMRRLIEDLLKLAMLETSEGVDTMEHVQVPVLLGNICEEARSVHGGVINHLISIEADQNLWIRGDRNQIYSAFSNLVFNAVQHTPDKGVIRVRWYERDGGAVLEVTDSGEGIPKEHIPRLTERFYRVDKGRSRERGGTGLGLAIVKHILALYGAALEIESELGKGSVFRCRFNSKYIIWKQEVEAPAVHRETPHSA